MYDVMKVKFRDYVDIPGKGMCNTLVATEMHKINMSDTGSVIVNDEVVIPSSNVISAIIYPTQLQAKSIETEGLHTICFSGDKSSVVTAKDLTLDVDTIQEQILDRDSKVKPTKKKK